LNVEGDVAGAMAQSCVWLAAVVARTGVLMFGVVGEALWVPPVDGDQFLFFDAEAGGVLTGASPMRRKCERCST
jgi:hypothetical protein